MRDLHSRHTGSNPVEAAGEKMKNPDKFLEDVLVFVDRNGSIVSKQSGEMSCSLEMKYERGDLNVKMHAYAHGMGNGSCGATVTYKGEKVFHGAGSFTVRPYNSKIETYIPGEWEQLMRL
jgi:hypothetical protein